MYYSFTQPFFNVIALWQRFICIYSFIIGLRVLSGGGRKTICKLRKIECDSQKKECDVSSERIRMDG